MVLAVSSIQKDTKVEKVKPGTRAKPEFFMIDSALLNRVLKSVDTQVRMSSAQLSAAQSRISSDKSWTPLDREIKDLVDEGCGTVEEISKVLTGVSASAIADSLNFLQNKNKVTLTASLVTEPVEKEV